MALIHIVTQLLKEESSPWLQISIVFKDIDLNGWKEFFDIDFPQLSLNKFEKILSKCYDSDIKTFFKTYKTPGQFLITDGGNKFIKELFNFSNDVSDIDEFIKIVTDKYSKRK